MANLTEEEMQVKQQAEDDAAQSTDWERQRFEYYRSLRFNFQSTNVDNWLNKYYYDREAIYKPQNAPSWNQIRKDAGIGFLEYFYSFINAEEKKKISLKKEESRKKLQARVDADNAEQMDWCRQRNEKLSHETECKLKKLLSGDADEVEKYFQYVLNTDSYALNGTDYQITSTLMYIPENKRLVIDYNLPTMEDVSDIKEWKIDKDNNKVPKRMNKSDYLEMYERILFDICFRVVGIVFESDNKNVVREIVLNGSCVYSNWQQTPSVILSFLINKNQFSYERARKMDFISKTEIAKLENTAYLDDIHSPKAPADLWETPPTKLVVPIQSCL